MNTVLRVKGNSKSVAFHVVGRIEMRSFFIGLFIGISMLEACASTGGIQLNTSRIVYKEGDKAISYAVTNRYDNPSLASAVVTNFDTTPTADFSVSPSLYQIQPKSTVQGKVIQLQPINADTEKVYWLNVKTIIANDSSTNENSGTLQFAIAQRIKLFYRPKTIKENCRSAAEGLSWVKTKTGLKAINNSRVSVSLVHVKLGGHVFRISDTVLPKTEKEWEVNIDNYLNATFQYVDEYGNFIDHPIKF